MAIPIPKPSYLPKIPYYYIPFSHHYPKFDNWLFTTIRPDKNSLYYRIPRIYAIKVNDEEIGFAQLIGITKILLKDIPLTLIHFDTDENQTKETFFAQMVKWYLKKPFWNADNTRMLILFLLWIQK